MKKCAAFCFLIFCSCLVFGQNKQIDSLKAQLIKPVTDTVRIKILNKLSDVFMQDGNLDTALVYAQMSEKTALGISGNMGKRKLGGIYNNIGYIYEIKGEYTQAISSYEKALQCKESLNDEMGAAATTTYMGLVYSQLDLSKGMAQYFKALAIYERNINSTDKKTRELSKSGIAALYHNIGIICIEQKEFKKALEYYEKALAINIETNNRKWIAQNYGNIGIVYTHSGDLNKARDYSLKSLKINKELGEESSIGHSYHALGDIYLYRKEYQLALDYFQEALAIFEKQSFKRGVASCYGNIGMVYLEMKNYKASEEALKKGLKLSEETGGWEGIRDLHGNLNELYEATGKPKLALEHFKEYVIARDSLVNEANTKKTVQQQMQYEFDKREAAAKMEQEKRDAIASAESRKQKIIITAVSAGLVFILILSFVILRSLRLNQKKNQIISEQKQVVELQKELVEEKQREILDSIHYAKRIQMALMPQERYISKKLKKL